MKMKKSELSDEQRADVQAVRDAAPNVPDIPEASAKNWRHDARDIKVFCFFFSQKKFFSGNCPGLYGLINPATAERSVGLHWH